MPERVPCPDHQGDPLENDDCIGRYLAMREQGHGAAAAAREINTTPQAVRKRIRQDPIFAEAVTDADHAYAETIEDRIRALAEDSDKWAMAIILKRKNPETYGPLREERKPGDNAQGNVTLQIGTVNVSDLDGVQALAKALAARKTPQAVTQPDPLEIESREV